ncbi:PiggyBac transposable element-derived protein 4 [Araneus ventricosus]|uniref:PiggyBac transposable element-derived protein 4 n=1 Tax=Araneus ventricosus TaxID=182803 RepID=A0A4Y2DTE1_ARAVE|nr:PiggyBac transposable element-derived protein 4 [Araneus ventricosus]
METGSDNETKEIYSGEFCTVVMETESDNEVKEIYSDKFSDVGEESNETVSDNDTDNDVMMSSKGRNVRQIIYDSESSASEDESDGGHINWTKCNARKKLEAFNGNPGIKIFPNDPQSIKETASLFIGDDFIEMVAKETNKYYLRMHHGYNRQKEAKWVDITVPEMKKFLALFILMGQVRKTILNDYWSTDPVTATPFFAKVMTRNRFRQILWFLHFSDNPEMEKDSTKLSKTEPIANYFLNKFNTVYKPEQELFVDEAVIPYHGHLSFRVCDPSEITKYGIHATVLCESSSRYICNFKLHCGKEEDLRNGISTVLNGYENAWHHVYMDHYYNSVTIAENLLGKNIRICGTVRKNRGFPKELSRLKSGEFDFRQRNEVLVLKWKGNRKLQMISTIHNADIEETDRKNRRTGEMVCKPKCIVKYNQHMKGFYLAQQYFTKYAFLQQSVKWTKKTFLFLVHCGLFNSFIVYRKLNPFIKITFSKYLLTLAKEWISCHIEDKSPLNFSVSTSSEKAPRCDPPHRLTGDIKTHYLERIPRSGKTKYPQKRCKVCKSHGKRTDTSFLCASCRVPLCKGHCFQNYHTKKEY